MPLWPSPLEGRLLRSGLAPTPLLDLWQSQMHDALVAANRAGIFRDLAGGSASPARLAKQAGHDLTTLRLLLRAIEPSGYVVRVPGVYALGPPARRWPEATEALLQDGGGATERILARLRGEESPQRSRSEQRQADDRRSIMERLAVPDLVRRVPTFGWQNIAEVGADQAVMAQAMMQGTELQATIHCVDGPDRARWAIEDAGLGGRTVVHTSSWDRLEIPAELDAIFMGRTLTSLDPTVPPRILSALLQRLRPGGLLVLLDAFDTKASTTAAAVASRLHGLEMHVEHGGHAHAVTDVVAWLRASGYVRIRHRRATGSILVTARRRRSARPPKRR